MKKTKTKKNKKQSPLFLHPTYILWFIQGQVIGHKPEKRVPDLSLPSLSIQLFRRLPQRYSPACPGSPPHGTCQKHLNGEVTQTHPNEMAKPLVAGKAWPFIEGVLCSIVRVVVSNLHGEVSYVLKLFYLKFVCVDIVETIFIYLLPLT